MNQNVKVLILFCLMSVGVSAQVNDIDTSVEVDGSKEFLTQVRFRQPGEKGLRKIVENIESPKGIDASAVFISMKTKRNNKKTRVTLEAKRAQLNDDPLFFTEKVRRGLTKNGFSADTSTPSSELDVSDFFRIPTKKVRKQKQTAVGENVRKKSDPLDVSHFFGAKKK